MYVNTAQRRRIATQITAARAILVRKLIRDLRGWDQAALEAEFARVVNTIPWLVRMDGGDQTRITHPVIRKIEREGLLAQDAALTEQE
jgi:hypothetical protein